MYRLRQMYVLYGVYGMYERMNLYLFVFVFVYVYVNVNAYENVKQMYIYKIVNVQ